MTTQLHYFSNPAEENLAELKGKKLSAWYSWEGAVRVLKRGFSFA